jgi:regulator of sigma E protease
MTEILTFVQYLIAFLAVLSLIVVVHECGHFFVARFFGVKVEEFSFGFGKELWAKTDKKGTRWKICLIPLGGYVKMLGDEDASSSSYSLDKVPEGERKYTFAGQARWKQALIIVAGPAMNYVFAIILLMGLFMTVGEVKFPPVIGGLMDGYPAQTAGLQIGDRILTVNDKEINDYTDISRIVQISDYGRPLTIKVLRNKETLSFTLLPKQEEGDNKIPLIGIQSSAQTEVSFNRLNPWAAFKLSLKFAYDMTKDTLTYLGQVLTGSRSAKEMRGPVGIAEASGDASKEGGLSFLLFIIQISLGVGFMNLLPVPVLDGGHLLIYLIEGLIRRPLPEKVQKFLMSIGLFVLLGLFLWTMALDIPRIIQRVFLK